MTNTPASDVMGTFEQAIRVFEAGADYVRISTPTRESTLGLRKIREELRLAGFDQPLVADIHFKPELALIAARLVEKVRINPGNYTSLPRKGKTDWTNNEYAAELERTRDNLAPLISVCRDYGTAIRVGTNAGSLSPRIVSRYGNTPEGLVQSTIEFLKIFEDLGFYQSVVSLKASNPLIMIRSYLLMAERMLKEGMSYPLHVGVTEAGEGRSGRIKSALGICTLLKAGIGDTIRVSLSEPPEDEIPVARKIAAPFQQVFQEMPAFGSSFKIPPFEWSHEPAPPLPGGHKAIVIGKNQSKTEVKGKHSVVVYAGKESGESHEEYPLFSEKQISQGDASFHPEYNFVILNQEPGKDFGQLLKKVPGPVLIIECSPDKLHGQIKNLRKLTGAESINAGVLVMLPLEGSDEEEVISGLATGIGKALLERKLRGIWAEAPNLPSKQTIINIGFDMLQAAGLRITQTEFISCPTCARTSFDLQDVLKEVKEKTSHLPGIKIAVMGCVVNGPGEMADADFGILGAGPGKVNIYRRSNPVLKNIDQHLAADRLLELINTL